MERYAFETYHSEINSALDMPAATMVPPIRLPDMETNNPAQKAQPTYPAGMINIRHPPRYFVTPPVLSLMFFEKTTL
jgi:hypothetical protein